MERGTAEEEALGGLTLDALLSLATQNNPTLVHAQQQVHGTLGKAIEARLWPNPTVFYVAEQTARRFRSAKTCRGCIARDSEHIVL